MKPLILGLDTGGTHTDVVVLDPSTNSLLATAKALTTHHDLAVGIGEALKNLSKMEWAGGFEAVGLINLSTTLATNSVAEGLSSPVGLVMAGYDAEHRTVGDLTKSLPQAVPVFIDGGHDYYGRQEKPLDLEALEAAVRELDGKVDAWAVSSYFSVKNPSHEIEAARLIRSITDSPVTLGSALTGELNAIRRAATAALNAGLVLIINRLLDAVKKSAADLGLKARLMVVKGDGSLVSEDWARERPIETVVSGPAAGLVGARTLTRGFLEPTEKNLWVMDVGGTTTDLAFIENGLPKVNPNGARVGEWDTMTLAVETRTRGLGGDSQVSVDQNGHVALGPRRILPLCRLVEKHPKALEVLARNLRNRVTTEHAAYFLLPGAGSEHGLSDSEALIVESMRKWTPYPLAHHIQNCWLSRSHFSGLRHLTHPAIMISGFTPTDALRVLGLFNSGDLEASRLGASIWARRLNISPETLCRNVLDEFGRLMAEEILTHAFNGAGFDFEPSDYDARGLLGEALKRREKSAVSIGFKVNDPVVLLGAPAAVLAPWFEKFVPGARVLVPPAYEVASAAGAAASPIYLTRKIEIQTLPNFAGYRLFLPDHYRDAGTLQELADLAEGVMTGYMEDLARLAGAEKSRVTFTREDRKVVMGDGSRLVLGSTLVFTAQGGGGIQTA